MNKRILLINGSPAENSSTGVLLKYLEGLFAARSCQTKFLNLNDLQLPYNNPLYRNDAAESEINLVREFSADVDRADVVVLGSPLYHGSYSGMLKVALDNLDGGAFEGKKIVLASTATKESGALQAGYELVHVCRNLHGDVYYRQVGASKSDFVDTESGKEISSEHIMERCQHIVDAVCV
jgi:azobenzene reductase